MIYLDYQANTPLAPEAREAMLPWLGGEGRGFGNPHSVHKIGRTAAATVEYARDQVERLFPAGGRVIFTSGATEAINLALRGSAGRDAARPVAISAIEHAAVGDTADTLGCPVVRLPSDAEGIIQPDAALPEGVRLVAVMQVNNEIGTIQPVEQWAERARQAGALFVCDAVQAGGKLPLAQADMIALSAHKMHGPIGIGALWLRGGVELEPVQTGGGQEAGLRSGTLSPALCAGFGAAAELALARMEQDAAYIENLWNHARDLFAGWTLNGSAHERWHGNLNIRKHGLDVARLMSDCRSVMFSAGSACASGSGRPSHVLQAIGLDSNAAKNSIRLGFGRYTQENELAEAARLINQAARAQEV
ncbi:MAG: cysteine desulfurase family protein [Sphingomonadaceae bacterium]